MEKAYVVSQVRFFAINCYDEVTCTTHFFRQFQGVHFKAFGVVVTVQRPKADSSKGDVEEPLHPSPAKASLHWT